MSKSLVLCVVLALHAGFAGASTLPRDLNGLLEDFPVPRDRIGLYIAPLGDSEKAMSLNASKAFNPASVIKLLPSLAALESLSPAYQWNTSVYTTGRISNGVLDGNLYIQGGGDPYLTVDSLWDLLKNVRAQGIERIAGDILLDDGIFEPVAFDRAAFDDQPYHLYNGPASGLLVNFWSVRFTIRTQEERVHIDAFPDSERLTIVNNIKHSDAGCTASRRWVRFTVSHAPDEVVVIFNGELSSRCRPVVLTRAVIPDTRYAQYVLPGVWRDAGGTLAGRVRRGMVPADAVQIVAHPSRSLAEVVRTTNKFSNNMMARHLLLTLGTLHKGRGIGLDDGIQALQEWILSKGLDVPGLHIDNGSGLSRDVRISAQGMANLLRIGFHSRYAPEFLAAFPIAGEDRALQRRDFGDDDNARVRIKTGLLDHVRTMAGYITSRAGDNYIVVLLVNHNGVHQGLGTRMQNAVIRYVLDL